MASFSIGWFSVSFSGCFQSQPFRKYFSLKHCHGGNDKDSENNLQLDCMVDVKIKLGRVKIKLDIPWAKFSAAKQAKANSLDAFKIC